jgi:DNA-binding MarR family transcriptional regulator
MLSDDELALWHMWKRATESVRAEVAADIAAETGLSDPDFGVLSRVEELGGGRLRQARLADSIGFHRSRLSHHLTRMESRGLISREAVGNGVDVVITKAGSAALKRARPVHAAAVRRHLLEPLSASQTDALRTILERLADR